MRRILLVLTASVLLTACGDDTPSGGDADLDGGDGTSEESTTSPAADAFKTPDDWPPASERRLREDHEPTPFSAGQIARACGPESKRVMRFEPQGRDTYFRVWTFSDQTDEGATWHDAESDEAGVENGTKKSNQVTWKELQSHASWPTQNVTGSNAKLKTPAGTYDCMHYVVTQDGAAGPAEYHYWFAYDLPGPPIRLEQYVRGTLKVTITTIKAEGIQGR